MFVVFQDGKDLKLGKLVRQHECTCRVLEFSGQLRKMRRSRVWTLNTEDGDEADWEILEKAKKLTATIDSLKLWRMASGDSWEPHDLANLYFGCSANSEQILAILLIASNPDNPYFRIERRLLKPITDYQSKLIMEARARKLAERENKQDIINQLEQGNIPDQIERSIDELLFAPNKSKPAYKALRHYCEQEKITFPEFMIRAKLVSSIRDYHVRSFVSLRDFDNKDDFKVPFFGMPPQVSSNIFSIDREGTTEIDDAFSVRKVSDASFVIGVHIAVPALGVIGGSALDQYAKKRMTSVYFPDTKYTMLPKTIIKAFSLSEGNLCPVISLYISYDNERKVVLSEETKIESAQISRNLFLRDTISLSADCEDEITILGEFADFLAQQRNVNDVQARAGHGVRLGHVIRVVSGNPIIESRDATARVERIVAEIMMYTNARWGRALCENRKTAFYRVNGRISKSSNMIHDRIGVKNYAWCTSPLRRYVDLVNQRQLLSLYGHEENHSDSSDDEELLKVFDKRHTATLDMQRHMERFWTLRYLEENADKRFEAKGIKFDRVRLIDIPVTGKLVSDHRILDDHKHYVKVHSINLIDLSVLFRLIE